MKKAHDMAWVRREGKAFWKRTINGDFMIVKVVTECGVCTDS